MNDTTTAQTEAAATAEITPNPGRVFFRSDYAYSALVIRRMRATKGSAGMNPKPEAAQVTIDALLHVMAQVFQADSEAHNIPGVAPFDGLLFRESTLLG